MLFVKLSLDELWEYPVKLFHSLIWATVALFVSDDSMCLIFERHTWIVYSRLKCLFRILFFILSSLTTHYFCYIVFFCLDYHWFYRTLWLKSLNLCIQQSASWVHSIFQVCWIHHFLLAIVPKLSPRFTFLVSSGKLTFFFWFVLVSAFACSCCNASEWDVLFIYSYCT
jgi:hypothetical protein